MQRDRTASTFCYAPRDHSGTVSRYVPEMARYPLGRHYIKEWRLKRGYSLRRLANMMEAEPGGDLILSHASLARIEKGEQPFSEEILAALADALNVSRSDLLEINPQKDGEVVDLMRRMTDAQRAAAVEYMNFLLSKNG